MKLSKLIAYRNFLLEKSELQDVVYQSERKFESILHAVKTNPIQIRYHTQTLDEDYINAKVAHQQFNNTLNTLIADLESEISSEEKSYYENSEQEYISTTGNRYDGRIIHSLDIVKRTIHLDPETKTMITSRIKSHLDWKHAGMIIRPGREEFLRHMVECDPLYVVDHDEELINESLSHAEFNDEYLERIRQHYISNTFANPNEQLLKTIPNGQIGFCLVYNFFNFVSISAFEKYLKEIYTKLKPGGIVCLTFNDCDYEHGVNLVEKNYGAYTPGKKVVALAKQIGYKQMFSWRNGLDFSWLELRKPGNLVSYKGGQSLAKIIPKTLAKSK